MVVVGEDIGTTRGCAITRAAEDYFVFVPAFKTLVIPAPCSQSRQCEPPGRREAPPDDGLREAIHFAE
jgi:hypothetical protein